MNPDVFRRHIGVHMERAHESLGSEIGALITKAAAQGTLRSGGTVRQMARVSSAASRAFAVALLNDYEAGKRRAVDRELLRMAGANAEAFARSVRSKWPLQRIGIEDVGAKPADLLAAEILNDVLEIIARHGSGLPVEGVQVLPATGGHPLWAGYERWVRANPGLAQLSSFLITSAIAAAALAVAILALAKPMIQP